MPYENYISKPGDFHTPIMFDLEQQEVSQMHSLLSSPTEVMGMSAMLTRHTLHRRVQGCSTGKLRFTAERGHATVFGSSPLAVTQARRWVRSVTGLHPARAFSLELVVSELASNAIKHSASGRPGGFFTLRIAFLTSTRVRVAVTDGGPQVTDQATFPGWNGACPGDDHGRGLVLVKKMSRHRFGVLGVVGGPLTVWAVLDRTDLW